MFKDIFLFEIKYRANRPATYLYFLIFFLMVLGATVSDNVTIGEQAGNMLRNSPSAIFRIIAIMSAFGMLVTSAIMSTPVLRDFEHGTNHLLYSYPMGKFSYLAGRFLGSYLFAVLVFLSLPLGIIVGSLVAPTFGWIEASRFDTFHLTSYLKPFLLLVLPNVFFTGAIFFTLTSLKRKMIYSYLGSVLLLVLYAWGASKLSSLESKSLAALIDPFGIASFAIETQYWTPAEVNSLQVPLTGKLLANRMIWIALGAGLFVFTYFRFRLLSVFEGKPKKKTVNGAQTAKGFDTPSNAELPIVGLVHSKTQHLKQMFSLGWLEFISTIKEVPFIGIVVAGILLLASNSISVGEIYGTNTYPVTPMLLDFTSGNFLLIIFIIITFYSGEIIWRERGYGINQITDTLPLPSWLFAGSKVWAMFLILVLLLTVLLGVNILTQVFHGFYQFNLPLYFTDLYTLQLPFYMGVAILAMLIQTIAKNKYVGHVVVMFYYIFFFIALDMLRVEHYLFKFPQVPSVTYSDMNGFGHFLSVIRWYQLAWLFLGISLFVIMVALWSRGFKLSLRNRLMVARAQAGKKLMRVLIVTLAGFALTSAVIIYNTTILNKYINSEDAEKQKVIYENTYKKYQGIPQPKVKAVKAYVDIFPEGRDVTAHATFTLKNETSSAIDSVHLALTPNIKLVNCEIGEGSSLAHTDKKLGYYIVKLQQPLLPNDTITMNIGVERITKGFVNSGGNTSIVHNGTFFNNFQIFPAIGYQESEEIEDRERRKKHNLPPKARMASITDSAALMHTYLGTIGDWIDFEAVVSTTPTQIAIAPGYLQKEWKEKGRRYFHYKMERPMLNFYSFISAKYEVRRDQWNDVELEVYYHKEHDYNIDKMVEAMKSSLDYFANNFSPFQHKVLRILEFPRYGKFAQSFSTTIPYSEAIGFIANLKNEEDIDYVYYVTAHEIAHQWWAHQVIGGNVQGATLMSEALAQYSALMVMEKRYGKEQMRKFLKHELDTYLRGRKREMRRELPITLTENQNYIHYNKGSVIMYALADYIGEENLNSALSMYLKDWAYKAPPFSTSTDFMKYINAVTPDSLSYLVHDMFETITLYDIRAKEATAQKLDDGRYKVTITAEVQKFRADSLGFETPLEFNDWIDVGVMTTQLVDGKKKPVELYMQKHRVSTPNPTFEVIVSGKPETVGLDPYNKLVDRHSDNNTVKVK